MGGSVSSNSFDLRKISSKADASKRAEVEPDTKSTENVAAQLLDPTVSSEEELEYQRFVHVWPWCKPPIPST